MSMLKFAQHEAAVNMAMKVRTRLDSTTMLINCCYLYVHCALFEKLIFVFR